jgi:hypothetical protein
MDATTFARWWQRRDLPNDKKILREAVAAGLVAKSGALIWLTAEGKTLCAAAED